MGKLIRDGVPAAIRASGGHIVTRALTPTGFATALGDKLVEEAQEAATASTDEHVLEEVADLYEVMSALVRLRGFTMTDVERAAEVKREVRGGFDLRLESVEYRAGDESARSQ
ncbi:nucleoside triphosphate pyrophosphohydrolase [Demequina sp. NBRC 110051]|uniref:nucleoside triphosphate pyrophosphohydrolase n=1 Tax=Demequina sp. NBRC 110051 TaxID=1570340 RepID=UPI000A079F29|nr:nucleoside triphosphate pyrophosphohydrolase [Demequina sp. NBRC 110051]